jgi:MFS family permease
VLNAVWAATIVLAEVPSGALADIIGRRRLVLAAAVLMVVEMALLCFVPRGNADLLFAVFLVNRICSGGAEAAASGADEALAYDALQRSGAAAHWGRVLEIQVRFQSIGYIVAMSLGAALYDPVMVQKAAEIAGFDVVISQAQTLRLPLYLTLSMALLALFSAWRMKETAPASGPGGKAAPNRAALPMEALRMTMRAGLWIVRTPFALAVILSGLLFDATVRLVITLTSQYYRVIHVPEALYGLIGSALAFLGLFVPRIAAAMSRRRPPAANFWTVGLMILFGLTAMAPTIAGWGVLPVAVLVGAMYLNGFFVSDYLNRIADSSQRATVLSFKGLSYNLAYGAAGLLYSMLLARLRLGMPESGPATELQNTVFVSSLPWFPTVFFVLLLALAVVLSRNRPYR